jgi:hypothetical protein
MTRRRAELRPSSVLLVEKLTATPLGERPDPMLVPLRHEVKRNLFVLESNFLHTRPRNDAAADTIE